MQFCMWYLLFIIFFTFYDTISEFVSVMGPFKRLKFNINIVVSQVYSGPECSITTVFQDGFPWRRASGTAPRPWPATGSRCTSSDRSSWLSLSTSLLLGLFLRAPTLPKRKEFRRRWETSSLYIVSTAAFLVIANQCWPYAWYDSAS